MSNSIVERIPIESIIVQDYRNLVKRFLSVSHGKRSFIGVCNIEDSCLFVTIGQVIVLLTVF